MSAFTVATAPALGVRTAEVLVVGSASTGFSLSPDAYPRAFHDYSDIDVAVVSEELFDTVWKSLLEWGHPRRYRLPELESQWFKDREDDVFWGWITPGRLYFDGLRYKEDLGGARDFRVKWFNFFRSLGTQFPDSPLSSHEVNGRLYRTRAHLLAYHSESLRRLRYRLVKAERGGTQWNSPQLSKR